MLDVCALVGPRGVAGAASTYRSSRGSVLETKWSLNRDYGYTYCTATVAATCATPSPIVDTPSDE